MDKVKVPKIFKNLKPRRKDPQDAGHFTTSQTGTIDDTGSKPVGPKQHTTFDNTVPEDSSARPVRGRSLMSVKGSLPPLPDTSQYSHAAEQPSYQSGNHPSNPHDGNAVNGYGTQNYVEYTSEMDGTPSSRGITNGRTPIELANSASVAHQAQPYCSRLDPGSQFSYGQRRQERNVHTSQQPDGSAGDHNEEYEHEFNHTTSVLQMSELDGSSEARNAAQAGKDQRPYGESLANAEDLAGAKHPAILSPGRGRPLDCRVNRPSMDQDQAKQLPGSRSNTTTAALVPTTSQFGQLSSTSMQVSYENTGSVPAPEMHNQLSYRGPSMPDSSLTSQNGAVVLHNAFGMLQEQNPHAHPATTSPVSPRINQVIYEPIYTAISAQDTGKGRTEVPPTRSSPSSSVDVSDEESDAVDGGHAIESSQQLYTPHTENPEPRSAKKNGSRWSIQRAEIPSIPIADQMSTFQKDAEKRIRKFLKRQKVTKRKPGFDWLSTLLSWFEGELAHWSDFHKRMEERVSRAEAERDKLQNERKKLQKRASGYDAAEKELQSKTNHINKLNADLKTLNNDYNDLLNDWKTYKSKLKQETADHMKLKADFNNLEQRFNETSVSLAQMREDYRHLNSEYGKLERNKQMLEQHYRQELANAQEAVRQTQIQMDGEIARITRQNEDNVATIKREAQERERAMDNDFKQTLHQKDSAHKIEKEGMVNTIASQNKRIAAYSTGDYTAISDQTFSLTFQTLSQQINNLVNCVPRPDSYTFNSSLDPTNFLARNAQQGNRTWPKFVKSVCWQIILRGFFQLPLGFGALGCQGEGYNVLFTVYQAQARPKLEDETTLLLPNEKKTNIKRSGLFEDILLDVRSSSNVEQGKRFTEMFQSNVKVVQHQLVATLEHICHDRLDPRAPSLISSMVHNFGVLALEIGSQRANILLETCNHGDYVNAGELFKDDNDSFGHIQVDLMTQPCLRRIGDGREDVNIQKVIVKGDVVSVQMGY